MAFNGYLVKIKEKTSGQGDYIIPNEYIEFESPIPLNGVLNLGAERDGEGILHMNALEHTVPKLELNLRPMNNHELYEILSNIQARYTGTMQERKMKAQLFLAEFNDYTEFIDVYMPDPEPKVKKIVNTTTLEYNSMRLAFIGC